MESGKTAAFLFYRNSLELEAISGLPMPDPDDLAYQSFNHEDLSLDVMSRGHCFDQFPSFDHIHYSWRCDQVKSEESQQNRHDKNGYLCLEFHLYSPFILLSFCNFIYT